MKTERYILDKNGRPVPEPNLFKWAEWYEGKDRFIFSTERDGFRVSTIFLALDHNFSGDGPPILWETMVFARGKQDGHELHTEQDRCSGSREQAEAMHLRMCAKVWPGVEIKI